MSSMNDMLVGLNRIIDDGGSTDPTQNPQLVRPPRTAYPTLIPDEWSHALASIIPTQLGKVASAPTGLYSLLDSGVNLASNAMGQGDTHIPGGQAAGELTESIAKPFKDVAANVNGGPVKDELLSGTVPELAASWLGLGMSALPAPAAAYTKLAEGLSKLKSGNVIVDSVGKGLIGAAEVLTPITIA